MKWNYYKKTQKLPTTIKAALIVLSIVAVSGSVSYAALVSQQAKLTGNTVKTATANLQVSNDGVNYSDSLAGYSFTGLIPGGQALPVNGYVVCVKNTGDSALALKFAISSTPLNPDNVDLTKVHVIVTPTSGGSPQNYVMQSLITPVSSGGLAILTPTALLVGESATYHIQISMDIDALSGPSASISNLDFSFSGTAISQ